MFRFTIRDVLWLTVVVAMGCGWWSQQAMIRKERAELAAKRRQPSRVTAKNGP